MRFIIDQMLKNYCQQKVPELNSLETRIRQGLGADLFQSLLEDMKEFSDSKIERQVSLMQCLEHWWDQNKLVASYLMARLLPQAAKLIDNHRLCNAIENYLTSGKDLAVSESIQLLLKEDLTPFYKKKYHLYLEQL